MRDALRLYLVLFVRSRALSPKVLSPNFGAAELAACDPVIEQILSGQSPLIFIGQRTGRVTIDELPRGADWGAAAIDGRYLNELVRRLSSAGEGDA